MGIFPGLLSSEVEAFSKTVGDLIDSCVADGFEVSDATRWAWIGAAATQVSWPGPEREVNMYA